MAQIPDTARSIIERFLAELTKNGIIVEQAVLFGSYAQGTFNEWSDIDLAVVSSKFEGERFLVLHLMIAGRLYWRDRLYKVPTKRGLAAFDFPGGSLLVTEAGSKKRRRCIS